MWLVGCGGNTSSDPDQGSSDSVADVADSVDDSDSSEIVMPPDLGKEELPPDVPEVQCVVDGDCDTVLTDLTICQESRCVDSVCVAAPVADDTPCDDADQCTLDTVCLLGECADGTPRDCEDGNECTMLCPIP